MRFHGKCHCGNISFTYDMPNGTDKLPVRICDCSFCRKHGGLYTSQPDAMLTVALEDKDQITRYRFGTKTADYYVCGQCGANPFVTCAIDDSLFAIVNINCLEDLNAEQLVPAPVDFEGESIQNRIARRKQNWVGEVKFVSPGSTTPRLN